MKTCTCCEIEDNGELVFYKLESGNFVCWDCKNLTPEEWEKKRGKKVDQIGQPDLT